MDCHLIGAVSGRWRSCSGRRNSLPSTDVSSPRAGVIAGRQALRLGLVPTCSARLFKISLEEGNAPPAARSRAAALAQLAGNARLVHAQVIENLALRHVEAKADFVVKLHGRIDSRSLGSGARSGTDAMQLDGPPLYLVGQACRG